MDTGFPTVVCGYCLGLFFCLVLGLGCALPLLAALLGCVCVCVRAPLVPRQSWRGCAVWVWVLGVRFQLRPATPGCGVEVFLCLCPRSTCTPPILAWVRGVGVPAWARATAATRHSWLGYWGLFVFACALRLYPATPLWAARCGCVCLGSGFGCAPPLLARGRCVCVFVCALRLYPVSPGWGARFGCVGVTNEQNPKRAHHEPQPEMAGQSRDPSPSTRTLDPGQEWRSHHRSKTQTHTPHKNRKPGVHSPGTKGVRDMQVTRRNEIRSLGVRLHPKTSAALGLEAERARPKRLET